MGRPRIGTAILIRLDDTLLAQVDAWAARHDINRAEAIRRKLTAAAWDD